MLHATARRALFSAAAAGLTLSTIGCNVVGWTASALPPPVVRPAYDGLVGETAAVVVWADDAVDINHPSLTVQVGQRVQRNLTQARDDGGNAAKRSLEGTSFPYPPESYVAYFKEDPTLAMTPIETLAPRFGARRVIYVEIGKFTTRGGAAAGLVRGVAEVNLVVYEVEEPVTRDNPEGSVAQTFDAGSNAREVYRESGLEIVFPENVPDEGSNRITPDYAYRGLVALMADTVSKRFVPHHAEE